jgi:hypothetical protein
MLSANMLSVNMLSVNMLSVFKSNVVAPLINTNSGISSIKISRVRQQWDKLCQKCLIGQCPGANVIKLFTYVIYKCS